MHFYGHDTWVTGNDKEGDERPAAFIYLNMSFKKRKYSILNALSSPHFSIGLQQRVSIVGEVGPGLIKFYPWREKEGA